MNPKPISNDHIARQSGAAAAFAEATAILACLRAPDGCPWDLEQTLDSIKPHTLEEVYEVFDAIDRRAWPELKDELGDLLLQVLFYAQIAKDEGHFGIEEVAKSLSAKLVRRHPHVFGDAVAEKASDVSAVWEQVKQTEKASKAADPEGLLGGVPQNMPGFLEAKKLGGKASKIGFDWPDAGGLFKKLQEEIAEVQAELAAETPNALLVEEEFGDLLFVMTNLARHLRVDPEQALKKANAKFRRRFAAMERFAGGTEALEAMEVSAMEKLWDQAKQEEKQA